MTLHPMGSFPHLHSPCDPVWLSAPLQAVPDVLCLHHPGPLPTPARRPGWHALPSLWWTGEGDTMGPAGRRTR